MTTSFGYDQADRLASYATSGSTTTYSYGSNGDGLRVSKTTTTGGTPSTKPEVWDLAEGLPLMLQASDVVRYVTGPDGLPLEQINTANSTTVVSDLWQDALGSTRLLSAGPGSASSTGVGNTVATFSFNLEGKLASSTGSVTTAVQYSGGYQDAESGYYYLRARYYDPYTASFLTVDPLVGMTGEAYSYAGDNPINSSDPSGLLCAGPLPVPFTDTFSHCSRGAGTAVRPIANTALKVLATLPYTDYYFVYRTQSSIHEVLPDQVNSALTTYEEATLYMDAGIDCLKAATGSREKRNDEDVNGKFIPWRIRGISTRGGPLYGFLPGFGPAIHGHVRMDVWPQHSYPWSEDTGSKKGFKSEP